MNKTYKITLDLWFEKVELTGDEEDDEMIEALEAMESDGFDSEAHLRRYNSKTFADYIMMDGQIVSARWLKGTKIQFVWEFNEPKKIEDVLDYLLKVDLENSVHREDVGWVAYADHGYEYGVYDYRHADSITIEAL